MILMNPDCRDGKHQNCTGGWDTLTDAPYQCPCRCHLDAVCTFCGRPVAECDTQGKQLP